MMLRSGETVPNWGFSALQRAEIAEILQIHKFQHLISDVSVLFNEPKLLKSIVQRRKQHLCLSFSALQRAEIAEIARCASPAAPAPPVSVLFTEPKLLKLGL